MWSSTVGTREVYVLAPVLSITHPSGRSEQCLQVNSHLLILLTRSDAAATCKDR